jgi:hypothetical protein
MQDVAAILRICDPDGKSWYIKIMIMLNICTIISCICPSQPHPLRIAGALTLNQSDLSDKHFAMQEIRRTLITFLPYARNSANAKTRFFFNPHPLGWGWGEGGGYK